jgi:hypothetical protein
MNTNYHHIDYNYAYFNFSWTWIRDKQIILEGNNMSGVMIIADEERRPLKVFRYERII